MVCVPHSGSGVAPMSSLSGVELLGFWEFGMGGLIGRQVSEREYKGKGEGVAIGAKGFGEKAKKKPRRLYM